MGDVAVEASSIELQRALLVARLMGVGAEWGKGPAAAPSWWLETWARRLATERLTPTVQSQVLDWLARVAELLAERPERSSKEPLESWMRTALEVREEGALMEALVAAELTPENGTP